MRIEKWNASKVPAEYHDRLYALTLGPEEGEMHDLFTHCVKRTGGYHGVVHIAYINNEIVGWTLRYRYRAAPEWTIHTYVDPRYRRRGVGTVLVRQSVNYLKKQNTVYCIGWDDKSALFWEKSIPITNRRLDIQYI